MNNIKASEKVPKIFFNLLKKKNKNKDIDSHSFVATSFR